MSKKVNEDLEKMNKDRRKAEEAYLASQQEMLEVHRIMKEGINNVEELVLYTATAIRNAEHFEDLARAANNPIMYSEAIGIKREFGKLLDLIFKDGSAEKVVEGTEGKHREENDGRESYA